MAKARPRARQAIDKTSPPKPPKLEAKPGVLATNQGLETLEAIDEFVASIVEKPSFQTLDYEARVRYEARLKCMFYYDMPNPQGEKYEQMLTRVRFERAGKPAAAEK